MHAIRCCPQRVPTLTFFIPAGCIWPSGPMEIICMSDLNMVLHTSISQHSEPGAARRMAGAVGPRSLISPGEREEMYRLFQTYFSGTSRHTFENDLAEKESVFLLRDSLSGQIQGFSTSMRLSSCIDDQEVVAFFSGDTIIARDYW